jgi:beta-galactosidase
LLTSASLGGKAVLGAMVPAVWRPLNSTELLLNKPPSAAGWPDLQRSTAQVKDWRVEEKPEGVLLHAEVDYRVNERNSFQIDYAYRVTHDGVLHVDYTVRPKVEAPYLPFVGMRATMATPLTKLRWLGLGPIDNWPNESAAAQLGVWTQGPPEGEAPGMKQARWADLLGSDGTGPRVEHAGYISLDPHAPRHGRHPVGCARAAQQMAARRTGQPAAHQWRAAGGRLHRGSGRRALGGLGAQR